MQRFRSGILVSAVALTVCTVVRSAPPSGPALFRATVTGKVKSAKPDGLSFVLTVAKADEDAVNNTGVEPAELVGKTVAPGCACRSRTERRSRIPTTLRTSSRSRPVCRSA